MSTAINKNFTDTLFNDFKAEVVAAEMVESGIPLDRLLIIMDGASKRSYRKDISAISEEVSDYDHKEYIQIRTHKEGIYDKLPEGLFHQPAIPKNATTEEEILKALKRHHEEEKNARTFFLPFEAAINDLRIQLALNENLLDKRLHNTRLVDIFSKKWEIFKLLDARQSNIFLQLLPLIHDMRDDYRIAAIAFELILQIPVQILATPEPAIACDKPIYSSLNNTYLGINFTTGNEIFFSGEQQLEVTIGPVDAETYALYMPGEPNAKIVEKLCDYFLPVQLSIHVSLPLKEEYKTTRIKDEVNDLNSALGWCTYL